MIALFILPWVTVVERKDFLLDSIQKVRWVIVVVTLFPGKCARNMTI